MNDNRTIEKSTRRNQRRLYQLERRKAIEIPPAIEPEVNPCSHPDIYDFYLSYRKGQPCWDQDNVYDTFQSVMDAAAVLYVELSNAGLIRPVTIWVDPYNPGGSGYGDCLLSALSSVPNGELVFSMTAPGAGSINEAWAPSYLGMLQIGEADPMSDLYVVLDIENLFIDEIIAYTDFFPTFRHVGIQKITLYENDNGTRSGIVEGEFISTYVGKIDAHEGYTYITNFDSQCLLGPMIIGQTLNTKWDGCANYRGPNDPNELVGGYLSWLVITDSFEDCVFKGTAVVAGGNLVNPFSLVTFFLSSTENTNIGFSIEGNIIGSGFDNALASYFTASIGSQVPKKVFVLGNINKFPNGKGAIGNFDDSVFGPNLPDNLDYSGVT